MKALIKESKDPAQRAILKEVSQQQLPDGEVLLRVAYSGINYKDALAVTGVPGIVRQWPMVLGIDLAGSVVESQHSDFVPGQQVIATGYGIGEAHWGGYAEYARMPASWLVPVPEGRDARWAMALGTAGLTAMLSVMALEDCGALDGGDQPVVVSGAGGGVGGVAIALLAALNKSVIAVTGRPDLAPYLQQLGATELIDREDASRPCGPLEKGRWMAAVDTVGGPILARLIAQTHYGGAIAISGMAASTDYAGSVIPFILRGLTMIGIESVACPVKRRLQAWQQLDKLMPDGALTALIAGEVQPEQIAQSADQLLAGQVRGRLLVHFAS